MSAMYATQTFVTVVGGASHLVMEGSLRDSLSAVVTAAPSLFTASPPAVGKGHVDGKLAQYLAAYPTGP
jgi:hypothetical protein